MFTKDRSNSTVSIPAGEHANKSFGSFATGTGANSIVILSVVLQFVDTDTSTEYTPGAVTSNVGFVSPAITSPSKDHTYVAVQTGNSASNVNVSPSQTGFPVVINLSFPKSKEPISKLPPSRNTAESNRLSEKSDITSFIV